MVKNKIKNTKLLFQKIKYHVPYHILTFNGDAQRKEEGRGHSTAL